MKMKYDESDNMVIRASRAMTDRVTGFLGKEITSQESGHTSLNKQYILYHVMYNNYG